jgi:hypothetical protein
MTEQQALDFGDFGFGRSAVLSPDERYRYRLDRRWSDGPTVAWVMLNPSTANGVTDDATLTRITRFTRGWGFGALTVVNLYAWRARDPEDLWTAPDPVGPDNDWHIYQAVAGHEVVVAWGAHAKAERIAEVARLIASSPEAGLPHALALTKTGQPRHPLYLRGDLTPRPWTNPALLAEAQQPGS